MLDKISGDVVYAFRPHLGSLGVGLLHRRRTGTPVVLDVDDLVRFDEYPIHQRAYNTVVFSGSPTSGAYAKLLSLLGRPPDRTTVSSSYLQRIYGGEILPYGPPADVFNPDSVDPHPDLIDDNGSTPLLIFVGTIRRHKGLDTLASAVSQMEKDARIVIAGYDPDDQLPELRSLSRGRLDFRGPINREEVPQYLKAADAVALPQHDTEYTRAQVPKKVFEAMSMARPIVASRVGDLPEILESCGRLVPPESPAELATVLDDMLHHRPDVAKELGRAARERYVEQYSRSALRARLEEIFQSL
jgi:glycosyltransferase involved in cell wall biosynthesis